MGANKRSANGDWNEHLCFLELAKGLSSDEKGTRTYEQTFVDVSKETAGVIRSSEIKSVLFNEVPRVERRSHCQGA